MHVIAGEKMNTYRIAVCDDDPVMREQLHSFCRELLDGESIPYAITAFPSAAELEKRMNSDVEKPFNLLILDIQMNGMTGLELARSLRSKDDRISIIFVTACDNYLSEGYDVQPIHFLLKPICREALANAIRTDYCAISFMQTTPHIIRRCTANTARILFCEQTFRKSKRCFAAIRISLSRRKG